MDGDVAEIEKQQQKVIEDLRDQLAATEHKVCMYIHIYICVCVYMHTYIHTCVYIHIYSKRGD